MSKRPSPHRYIDAHVGSVARRSSSPLSTSLASLVLADLGTKDACSRADMSTLEKTFGSVGGQTWKCDRPRLITDLRPIIFLVLASHRVDPLISPDTSLERSAIRRTTYLVFDLVLDLVLDLVNRLLISPIVRRSSPFEVQDRNDSGIVVMVANSYVTAQGVSKDPMKSRNTN